MSDYIDTVDIEGTQYEIQDTLTKEQAEENTQRIEELGTLGVYSLEEIDTGEKWIDNKPIYRKCVSVTNNFTSGISLTSELDTLVSVRATMLQTSNRQVIFPYSANMINVYDGFVFGGYYNRAQNAFIPQIGTSLLDITSKIVWVFEYTKSA